MSLEGCPRTPRLRVNKLHLSLDKSVSFYARSVSRALNSFANLFFHYKSYPDFYTPPRQLSLSFDFVRGECACRIPFAAVIWAASKYPSENTARPDRSRRTFMRFRVHTRVHPCSSVHRLPHDKARRRSRPARTGVVEANVLAVGLKRPSASLRGSDITRAEVSGARVPGASARFLLRGR